MSTNYSSIDMLDKMIDEIDSGGDSVKRKSMRTNQKYGNRVTGIDRRVMMNREYDKEEALERQQRGDGLRESGFGGGSEDSLRQALPHLSNISDFVRITYPKIADYHKVLTDFYRIGVNSELLYSCGPELKELLHLYRDICIKRYQPSRNYVTNALATLFLYLGKPEEISPGISRLNYRSDIEIIKNTYRGCVSELEMYNKQLIDRGVYLNDKDFGLEEIKNIVQMSWENESNRDRNKNLDEW